ncbi:MAG: hypothetical protein U0174_22915 [Polyangiaceae bacterium]
MSLHLEHDSTVATQDEGITKTKAVKKLKVTTMASLKAGAAAAKGSLDQYGNGSNSGKLTTYTDQSGNKATGITLGA